MQSLKQGQVLPPQLFGPSSETYRTRAICPGEAALRIVGHLDAPFRRFPGYSFLVRSTGYFSQRLQQVSQTSLDATMNSVVELRAASLATEQRSSGARPSSTHLLPARPGNAGCRGWGPDGRTAVEELRFTRTVDG